MRNDALNQEHLFSLSSTQNECHVRNYSPQGSSFTPNGTNLNGIVKNFDFSRHEGMIHIQDLEHSASKASDLSNQD